MFNWLAQFAVLTSVNIRTLRDRRGWAAVAMIGIAGVVLVLLGVLSIGEGFRATMAGTGSPETAIILRAGADSEMSSGLSREMIEIVAQAPGVARSEGAPVASAELFVVVDIPRITTMSASNVPLRGVPPAAPLVRRGFRIVSGRMFEPGRNEVIVGEAASRSFAGLRVGEKHRWSQNDWTVVGIFSTGGTVEESELWCDVRVLQPAYHRQDTFQSVRVRLDSAGAFQAFKDALTTDPRLDVEVQHESDYFAGQSELIVGMVGTLGRLIAGLMAVGAVFGALNTMYNAVASRTREIATLRALGFRGGPVAAAVLAESLCIALAGGLIGGAVAYALFNGFQASTINWQSFSQVAFAFRVTPRLLVEGITDALIIGLIGGLFPAIRAARLTVASALREL